MLKNNFENFPLQPDSLTIALETTNIIFVSIFCIEMIIKLLGDGLAMYLSNGQNVFDGLIVVVRYVLARLL